LVAELKPESVTQTSRFSIQDSRLSKSGRSGSDGASLTEELLPSIVTILIAGPRANSLAGAPIATCENDLSMFKRGPLLKYHK
jgi:hypothetical protein